jgi:hypothetical protein
MSEQKYSKWTVEGEKKIKWICGCFQTSDNYFKFCELHNGILKKAIQNKTDELDMTLVIKDETKSITK